MHVHVHVYACEAFFEHLQNFDKFCLSNCQISNYPSQMLQPASGCPSCGGTDFRKEESNTYCATCGRMFTDIVSEVTFSEGTGANESFQSNLVQRNLSETVGSKGGFGLRQESRQLTIARGNSRIRHLGNMLEGISTTQIEGAQRLFLLCLQHKFLQGRKHDNVVAACLYTACRRETTPHMLIDFSDALSTNLYVLGSTFLKLRKELKISLPIIDPSLFIRRFAAQLEFDEKTNEVATTALRLVSRMKRDWMQIGRRPSGLCGAALLIAGRIHGFKRSQLEITRVVCVSESTLRKRLSEFSATPASKLTVEKFSEQDIDNSRESNPPCWDPKILLEIEEDENKKHGGKLIITSASSSSSSSSATTTVAKTSVFYPLASISSSVVATTAAVADLVNGDEVLAESFSDVDDEEIDTYLLGQREKDFKEKQWQVLFADWIAEQVQKANETMSEKALGYAPVKRQHKRKSVGLTPADSAAEATMKMLKHTGRSAKIDYEALKELFDDSSFLDAGT